MAMMKDSGVAWIGEIPEGWEANRLKFFLETNQGGYWGDDPTGINDTPVLRSTEITIDGEWQIVTPALRSLGNILEKDILLKSGDLLVTKSSGSDEHIGKCAFVSDEIAQMKCTFSNFMQRLSFKKNINSKLIWYFFNSNIFRSQLVFLLNSTSGLGNINTSNLRELRFCLPVDNEEQSIIASYLDRKCAQIDKAISLVDQGIEKLKAYKQSVITEAVTNFNNCQEIKIKNIAKIIRGRFSHRPRNDPRFFDGPFPFIQTGDISNSHKYITNYSQTLNDDGLSVSKIFKKNTIIMSIAANIGDVGILGFDACFPDSIVAFEHDSNVNKIYLYYLLLSLKKNFIEYSIINTQLNINNDIIGEIKILLPSISEQYKIASYLDSKCAQIDALISAKQGLREKLAAYKKSLIYECVTGKREVKNA